MKGGFDAISDYDRAYQEGSDCDDDYHDLVKLDMDRCSVELGTLGYSSLADLRTKYR